jgi:hypothetical protein
VFGGRLGQGTGLPEAVAEGLLAEDMPAKLDSPQGSRRVVMVGRRHEDRIDLLVHRFVIWPDLVTYGTMMAKQ